ncbi:MAG: methyltransferase domain-containing protein [Cyanosarcina radialis HA8281-LM2]|jgi:SAM-dependent methyltransferase|nr:methyltransferase domain-containing protein [Cyanosarcina radialis HA8281-LM2]
MAAWYNEDLAYIHDVGFGDYALKSLPGILEILKQCQISKGLIVDLGCGSGLSARGLHEAGYRVLGIDISAAAIAIAKTRVPAAQFRVESLFTAEIPPCGGAISIGECLSYLFDNNSVRTLDLLLRRIFDALSPGGAFVFDVVVPGQVPPGEIVKGFTEGDDWIVLVEKQEDRTARILTRRIITLRQMGELYRRTEEVHRQRLFDPTTLVAQLQQIGFQVETSDRYGEFILPPARIAFIARKPS